MVNLLPLLTNYNIYMAKKTTLSSLIPDNKNNNKHTAYGMDLLEKSVNKVGIIESITVSNDDKIISGNARHEIIGKNFTKEALVIETDGTQPIIIKRTDIESDTKQFYEASILANTTAKKNIDFDMEVIDTLVEEFDIDVVDLGVPVWSDINGVDNSDENIDLSTFKDSADKYLNNQVRQILLTFDVESHKKTLERLQKVQEDYNIKDDNSAAVLKLLEIYEESRS